MTLDQCGDVVSRDQVLAIFQFGSFRALYYAVQCGRFPPPDLTRPARWSRDALRLWWTEGRRVGRRQLHVRIAG